MIVPNKIIIFIFLVASLSACSGKKPFSSAKEINEECMLEMHSAITAVRLRDKGKSKRELAEVLPPLSKNSSRLLVYMHEILNETYQYRDLNEIIYPTYRFELCSRQLTGKPYPYNISNIYPLLLQCQHLHGDTASAESTTCIISSLQEKLEGR